MNIFERGLEIKAAAFDVLKDAVETGQNGIAVSSGDDVLFDQHAAMGFRARDILGIKALIEIDGSVDTLHNFRGSGGISAAPHCVTTHCGLPGVCLLSKRRYLLVALIAILSVVPLLS